jgi:hypothetical protein
MAAGSKPIEDVAAADVRRLLSADSQQPNAARHRYNALRRFFDYLQDEGLCSANPCLAIAKARRPRAPASRAHCLSLAQCAALWRAAEPLLPVHGNFVRFLSGLAKFFDERGQLAVEVQEKRGLLRLRKLYRVLARETSYGAWDSTIDRSVSTVQQTLIHGLLRPDRTFDSTYEPPPAP